ncbi:acyltransferase family protein [Mucilaginibacter jinjuensis]|uniref:Acyltransferase n=1 Tax=Mucilaginibacter jinjuensis TaxID=1176721 RepID=A0ABY7TC21_9SPHI|nr:acyltransferase [Mucilaginibacter jinjuensis]WCT13734.1 acyltransferase [Mucilaginibacter jinjuensis]
MQIFSEKKTIPHVIANKSSVYQQLDAWRALAAIWVVMAHACSTVITDIRVLPNGMALLSGNYLYMFSMSGQLGVAMFFVISGYCIVLAADNAIAKQKSAMNFLKARFRRIFPPYYASIVLAIALTLVFILAAHLKFIPKPSHGPEFINNSFLYYFSNLTLTQVPFNIKPIQAIYWSLCYEIAFYIIIAACIFLQKKLNYSLHGILFILTQLSLIWLILAPDTCPFPLDLWYLFGMGAFVYIRIKNPDNFQSKLFFDITSVLVLLFASLHAGHYTLGHPASRTQAIFGFVFSLVLLLLYRFDSILIKNRFIKILSFLGTMSYSIYLSHPTVIAIPRQLMIKMGFIGDKYWITLIVQVIIGIGVGYIFHIICERPFMSSYAKQREARVKDII